MADLLGGGAWSLLFRIEGSDFSDERIRGAQVFVSFWVFAVLLNDSGGVCLHLNRPRTT